MSLALLSLALAVQEGSASPDPDAQRRKAWFDEQAVYLKYRYGSAAVAEEALLSHARQAAAKADVASIPESARAHLDAAFTYARLGILADKCGRSEDSVRYFNSASEHLAKRNETVSASKLREAMAEIDSDWDKFLGIDPNGPQKGPRAEGCRPTRR